jgi:hypothetical protein
VPRMRRKSLTVKSGFDLTYEIEFRLISILFKD